MSDQEGGADHVTRAEDAAARAEAAARRAEQERGEASRLAEAADATRVAAQRAGRFSREFIVTVFAVVTTAFGFVVALAWNTALSQWLAALQKNKETWAYFVYALIVTLLAVLVIVLLTRLARRLGARPIEFKIATDDSEKK
jgi:Family of unknown function (DUF5654)